jgi:hypothetical protein
MTISLLVTPAIVKPAPGTLHQRGAAARAKPNQPFHIAIAGAKLRPIALRKNQPGLPNP